MAWFVYIGQAPTGRYYTGISNEMPHKRIQAHNSDQGAKFSHDQGALRLIYVSLPFATKSEARRREIQIKGWTREKPTSPRLRGPRKEKLIRGEWKQSLLSYRMNIDNLREAAQEMRKEFEQKQISTELLATLYLQYQPIENIGTFLRCAEEMFPKLNCGIASIYLKYCLRMGEIIQGKYGNDNHSFLLLDEKFVVDITADQYGGPPVYVDVLKPPWTLSST